MERPIYKLLKLILILTIIAETAIYPPFFPDRFRAQYTLRPLSTAISLSKASPTGMAYSTAGSSSDEHIIFMETEADAILAMYGQTLEVIKKGTYYSPRPDELSIQPAEKDEYARYTDKIMDVARLLTNKGGAYKDTARELLNSTAVIMVDVPTRLLLSGKDRDGKVFYRLTHIGIRRRVIYVTRKSMDEFIKLGKRGSELLATELNHRQQEIDAFYKKENLELAKTSDGREKILTIAHHKAAKDDPFGAKGDFDLLMAAWVKSYGLLFKSTKIKTEIGKLFKERSRLRGYVDNPKNNPTKENFKKIASLALQLAHAHELTGERQHALEFYEEAIGYFKKVQQKDEAFLPIPIQLKIICLRARMGRYDEVEGSYLEFLRGVVGRGLKQGEVIIFESYMEYVRRFLDEITLLMLDHAQGINKHANTEYVLAIVRHMQDMAYRFEQQDERDFKDEACVSDDTTLSKDQRDYYYMINKGRVEKARRALQKVFDKVMAKYNLAQRYSLSMLEEAITGSTPVAYPVAGGIRKQQDYKDTVTGFRKELIDILADRWDDFGKRKEKPSLNKCTERAKYHLANMIETLTPFVISRTRDRERCLKVLRQLHITDEGLLYRALKRQLGAREFEILTDERGELINPIIHIVRYFSEIALDEAYSSKAPKSFSVSSQTSGIYYAISQAA